MVIPASTPDYKGIVTKVSPHAPSETQSAGSRRSKGVTLFTAIDQSAEARTVGSELRETTLAVGGSPAAGTPIMDHFPLSALDLPLKVLIWDDDGETKVSYVAPAELVARYELPVDLEEPRRDRYHHRRSSGAVAGLGGVISSHGRIRPPAHLGPAGPRDRQTRGSQSGRRRQARARRAVDRRTTGMTRKQTRGLGAVAPAPSTPATEPGGYELSSPT
jgi:hypothetical protein